MKERKNETAMDEKISPPDDALIDLTLADEQADETKGGEYNTWRTNFGRTS